MRSRRLIVCRDLKANSEKLIVTRNCAPFVVASCSDRRRRHVFYLKLDNRKKKSIKVLFTSLLTLRAAHISPSFPVLATKSLIDRFYPLIQASTRADRLSANGALLTLSTSQIAFTSYKERLFMLMATATLWRDNVIQIGRLGSQIDK